MKNRQSISFHPGSREELLPDFDKDFPYIASRAEIHKYIGQSVPWHWHKTVELFYMESGTLEYNTPGEKICFPPGSGGLVNSNILHMTRALGRSQKTVTLKLRDALSEIWLMLLALSRSLPVRNKTPDQYSDKIKQMMIYIHEHYPEKISVPQLASAAYLSERECFRVFHDCLHMTPTDYLKNYRLQAACRMLAHGRESITDIGHACGLGSSSYFGKAFREYAGCSPSEYRRKWQDIDISGQETDISPEQAGL